MKLLNLFSLELAIFHFSKVISRLSRKSEFFLYTTSICVWLLRMYLSHAQISLDLHQNLLVKERYWLTPYTSPQCQSSNEPRSHRDEKCVWVRVVVWWVQHTWKPALMAGSGGSQIPIISDPFAAFLLQFLGRAKRQRWQTLVRWGAWRRDCSERIWGFG